MYIIEVEFESDQPKEDVFEIIKSFKAMPEIADVRIIEMEEEEE